MSCFSLTNLLVFLSMCSWGEGGGEVAVGKFSAVNNFWGVSVFPQTLVSHYLSHNNIVQQHFRREARLTTADYNGI